MLKVTVIIKLGQLLFVYNRQFSADINYSIWLPSASFRAHYIGNLDVVKIRPLFSERDFGHGSALPRV